MHSWVVDACVLSADAAVAFLFYNLYKSKALASDLAKTAENFSIDRNLATLVQSQADHRVAYACIRGTVEPAKGSRLLASKYTSEAGVIRRWTFEELKSKYSNGSWSDFSEVMKSSSEEIPFCLRGEFGGSVNVEDGKRAAMLDEALTLTYDHFTPKQTGVVGTVVDRLAGYVTKGFQETERMLKVGTSLLGFGELALEHGQLQLRAPTKEGAAFILSSRSQAEVVQSLRESASLYRTLFIVFCSAGAVWACVSLGRRLHKFYQNYRLRREMRLLRAAQAAAAASAASAAGGSSAAAAAGDTVGQPGDAVGESSACVVCLSNQRAVVNMDCRHVCMCLGCYDAMPAPKRCPVCRETIGSVIPIYMP